MTGSRPWLPYALVLGVGLSLGALQYALDNRDPLVFTIPILGVTAVTLLVMALMGSGGERAGMERIAEEHGLRYDGVAPLPSVTPILAGLREPAHVFTTRLPGRGPRVRLAQVRGRRVAIVPAPDAATDVEPARQWLATHRLEPEAGIEDGLLVVAVGTAVGYGDLVELTGDLYARLT